MGQQQQATKPAHMKYTDQGQTKVTFIAHEEPTPEELRKTGAGVTDLSSLCVSEKFLYMNDNPDRRCEVLNDTMQKLAPWIGRTDDGPGLFSDGGADLASVRQDIQHYVVRVKSCADGSATEVEGVRGAGQGRLNLGTMQIAEGEPRVVLYPGKILGVEGRKVVEDGDIDVVRLHDVTPLPVAMSMKGQQDTQATQAKRSRTGNDAAADNKDGPVGVLVTSGPYGKDGKETCKILQELTHEAEYRGAAALIIIGPLVEEREFDGTCYMDDTDEIMDKYEHYLNMLVQHRESQNIPKEQLPKICFVPSVRDVFHDYVFPQPAYDVQLSEMVHMLPNPATVSVGGITFGITSVDILRHVKNALPLGAVPGSATRIPGRAPPIVKKAAEEVIHSQCYYPMVPAHQEVPLDYSLSKHLEFPGGLTPDVLIVPSAVPAFADHVHLRGPQRTAVVNPSTFRRGADSRFVELRFAKPAGDASAWRRMTAQWWNAATPAPTKMP